MSKKIFDDIEDFDELETIYGIKGYESWNYENEEPHELDFDSKY